MTTDLLSPRELRLHWPMPATQRHRVVLVSAPLLAVGRNLARKVLEARAAACVNIIPAVESHYWWKGKLEKSNEVLLIIKTTSDHLKELRRLIKRNHPYELPEFVALPITEGTRRYLAWIDGALTGEQEPA